MATFKCKMCGGTLEITDNKSTAVCEYCGTQQTLPKLDDDRRINMYDRANHFRRNNEFDKATGIYEQILNEDRTDAEAYWSLVLCRYGIEYVEDPTTHKRVPTVNRAQFTSVFDDDNYKSALQYADSYQRYIYEEEAKNINEIQKGIIAISQKEEPFDVFICYKEADNNGRRTPDSVLANDLYHQLAQEGFRVFYARITLEDKLGSAYEPYIFAALNSAKVMVVLGTKPEYFRAVWVRNEWSRYLAFIKQVQKKMLIPAFKDMDPYDLPEEFSHLQAQDMSKLGFMQDLIRGIKKIVRADEPKSTLIKETVVSGGNSNPNALLKRAFMFLEDGDWRSADEYCEKVLDIDPENAQAYLGKLMAELRVKTQGDLQHVDKPFDTNNSFKKAIRFGDETLKSELSGYVEYINIRIENTRVDNIYNLAKNKLETANTETDFKGVATMFESISAYKDAALLAKDCSEKAEVARKDDILSKAKDKMKWNSIPKFKDAITLLESIPGWKDADECLIHCNNKIAESNRREAIKRIEKEERLNRYKKIAKIVLTILMVIAAIILFVTNVITPIRDAKQLKYADIGDTVVFGKYEQDNKRINGKEPIQWVVLDKKDGKILVLSKYVLDGQPYNHGDDGFCSVPWNQCSLRRWLNSSFSGSAFGIGHLLLIPTTTIHADSYAISGFTKEEAIEDKVFLLSIKEVNLYLKSDSQRQAIGTDYAKSHGAYLSKNGYSPWYLRTLGGHSAAGVTSMGKLDDTGIASFGGGGIEGIRPAMWIRVNE